MNALQITSDGDQIMVKNTCRFNNDNQVMVNNHQQVPVHQVMVKPSTSASQTRPLYLCARGGDSSFFTI